MRGERSLRGPRAGTRPAGGAAAGAHRRNAIQAIVGVNAARSSMYFRPAAGAPAARTPAYMRCRRTHHQSDALHSLSIEATASPPN